MKNTNNQPSELTDAMVEALNELGREVDRDHICDKCLSKMKSSIGFIGGLKLVLYQCNACGNEAVKEFLG